LAQLPGDLRNNILITSPKSLPVIIGSNIKLGIADYTATGIRIIFPLWHEPGADRIFENIMCAGLNRTAFPSWGSQDPVMGLMLPFCRSESRAKLLPEKFDCDPLIRFEGVDAE